MFSVCTKVYRAGVYALPMARRRYYQLIKNILDFKGKAMEPYGVAQNAN